MTLYLFHYSQNPAFKFCVVFTQHSVFVCILFLYLHHRFTSYLICTGLIKLFCFTSVSIQNFLIQTYLIACRSCCKHYGVNNINLLQYRLKLSLQKSCTQAHELRSRKPWLCLLQTRTTCKIWQAVPPLRKANTQLMNVNSTMNL